MLERRNKLHTERMNNKINKQKEAIKTALEKANNQVADNYSIKEHSIQSANTSYNTIQLLKNDQVILTSLDSKRIINYLEGLI